MLAVGTTMRGMLPGSSLLSFAPNSFVIIAGITDAYSVGKRHRADFCYLYKLVGCVHLPFLLLLFIFLLLLLPCHLDLHHIFYLSLHLHSYLYLPHHSPAKKHACKNKLPLNIINQSDFILRRILSVAVTDRQHGCILSCTPAVDGSRATSGARGSYVNAGAEKSVIKLP